MPSAVQVASGDPSAPGPAAQPATTEAPARVGWLDAARGFGIVLVVIGHALGGLIDSPIGKGEVGLRQAFFVIYTFHMPLFFMLSGVLVMDRLERNEGRFRRQLVPSIAWPYFLWSTIQFTIIFLMGSLVNSPAEQYWPTILSLPWKTVSQFWFLYALFWMHVLAILLLRRIGPEAFVLLALALKSLVLIVALPVAVKLVFTHLLFYAIGAWLRTSGIERMAIARPVWSRAIVLPLVAFGTIAATLLAAPEYGRDILLPAASSPEISNLAWRFPAMAAAIAGVVALVGIASLPRLANSPLLSRLGRLTMPIFLLHVMFIAGTRIGLMRSGWLADPLVFAVVLTLVGLIGPLVVEQVTRRLGLNRVLGF